MTTKKITCKICYSPLKIMGKVAKLTCMCDEEIRIVPLDKLMGMEYDHLIEYETEAFVG
jgi:hypothetical protein